MMCSLAAQALSPRKRPCLHFAVHAHMRKPAACHLLMTALCLISGS